MYNVLENFYQQWLCQIIGALIAFGFLAALFIDTGWIPNKGFNSLVSPLLTYLIPILISSTGGRMIGGDRGRVVGAIAVIGAIMSNTEITMLMAAMVMGPLAGLCVKKFDQFMESRMPAGFEMLINNFSAGIIGMILAMLGYVAIGPVMSAILSFLSAGVNLLVENSLLPLIAVFIEPAKVLFLNNAINQGIFTPLAMSQAADMGKSIMYMLETNPGPGLGVLLAYMFFCKDKVTKDSAPGAVIIHLLGGIHEIYFPYVLNSRALRRCPDPWQHGCDLLVHHHRLRTGRTGFAGIDYRLPDDGSGIRYNKGNHRRADRHRYLLCSGVSDCQDGGRKSLEEAQSEMASMKAASADDNIVPGTIERSSEIKKIIFACDAGMGSSAMGATKFRNRIKNDRPDISVSNTSVDNILADCDIAVVQTTLAARAKKSAPQAQLITIGNFLADPALDALYVQLTTGDAPAAPAGENTDIVIPDTPIKKQVIVAEGIKLGQKPVTKEEAIQTAGELLEKLGYVDDSYVVAMQERERLVSTYMGMGVAIPHGTTQVKDTVKKTGIVLLQYPEELTLAQRRRSLYLELPESVMSIWIS